MFAACGAAGLAWSRGERRGQQAIDGRKSLYEAVSRPSAIVETVRGRAEGKVADVSPAHDIIASSSTLTTILDNAPVADAGQ